VLKSKKQQVIDDLSEIYGPEHSVIVTHYHGLTVSQLNKLRKSLKEHGGKFRIVKNTLSRIALSKSGIPVEGNLFVGPAAIAYSKDPVAVAKSVVDFATANDNFKIVGGIVNNKVLNIDAINRLSKMPSLPQLQATLIGLLQAPATKITRLLNTPLEQVVRVIATHAEKN
jgi:large subunit ribosomal protein L10